MPMALAWQISTTERLAAKFDGNLFIQMPLPVPLSNGLCCPWCCPTTGLLRACQSLGLASLREARIIRIKNTLHLSEMLVSESVYKDISELPAIRLLQQPSSLQFSREGYLLPFK